MKLTWRDFDSHECSFFDWIKGGKMITREAN